MIAQMLFTPKDQRGPNLSEIVVQTQPHFDEGYRKLLRSLFETGKSLQTPFLYTYSI